MSEKMLLLTGEGKVPHLVYQRASLVAEVLILSSPLLCPEGDLPVHFWWKSFSVEKLLHLLKENQIRKVCLAGKFPKKILFERNFLPPEIAKSCPSFQDKLLIQKVMDILASEGMEIVSPIHFLSEYLTPPGTLVGDSPEELEWSDIALGCRIAGFLADEEIGQTVVVSKGTVLALEGIEGTDETIVRGLTLGRGGVVVKVARTYQDFFIDVPVIGLKTVELVGKYGGRVLAIESRKTLFLDREESCKKAQQYSLSIVGIERYDE